MSLTSTTLSSRNVWVLESMENFKQKAVPCLSDFCAAFCGDLSNGCTNTEHPNKCNFNLATKRFRKHSVSLPRFRGLSKSKFGSPQLTLGVARIKRLLILTIEKQHEVLLLHTLDDFVSSRTHLQTLATVFCC